MCPKHSLLVMCTFQHSTRVGGKAAHLRALGMEVLRVRLLHPTSVISFLFFSTALWSFSYSWKLCRTAAGRVNLRVHIVRTCRDTFSRISCRTCAHPNCFYSSKKAKLTSQAVSVVDEVVKWVIESRMCEYGDETQWRSRAHLEALPPPSASKHTLPQAAPPVQTETSQGARAGGGEAGSRLPFNGVSGNQSVASAYSNSSEVINLMSDSDDD